MPTRRAFSGLAAGALITATGGAGATGVAREARLPAGACDSHVHVIGDPSVFPMDADRDYTPQPATAKDLKQDLQSLGLDRAVIVMPTIYGFDVSATLSAIAVLGRNRACGSVFVESDAARSYLEHLSEGGVVGLRLFLTDGENFNREKARAKLAEAIGIARTLGWHLQIASPPDAVNALSAELSASPVPIVFDAFGWLAGGVGQPGFETIRGLMRSGVAYAKLAQPYKLSKSGPDYEDVTPLARALVEANPDRVIWGSGWPHVPSNPGLAKRTEPLPPLRVDTNRMLELLDVWAPDPVVRRRILVDNAERLFGFPS